MRIFLDTNILLDVLMNRPGLVADSEAAILRCEALGVGMFVAWHGLATAYYLLRRERTEPEAMKEVDRILAWARVAPAGEVEAQRARSLGFSDFEDAMQAVSAEACRADWIITRDTTGFANSPAPAATPQVAPSSSAAPASPPLSGVASPNMTPPAGIAAPAPAAEMVRAADTRMVKLGFRTQAECWVEVYDKEGRQLFFDLARRGTRQDVAGAGPLRLVLGNAPAIRFELGGRELTVPAALQRKSTAFITISADGHIEQAL